VPVNEQARQVLDRLAGAVPLAQVGAVQARVDAWQWSMLPGEAEPVASVEHTYLSGPTAELPVTVYRPELPVRSGPPQRLPAIVMLHGGGWVVGNIALADRPHRALANATGCVVVAVNYQKAPEHPFPTALDDACAGLDWTFDQAERLGVDPARIGIGGDSAGGNLAAAVALRARDRGGAAPAFQVLIYPALDARLTSPSAAECAAGYGLDTADMHWFWQQYLPDPAMRADPLACPSRAGDLSGLCPAVVITVEYDPLRDEAREYALRLRQAGVRVIHREYPGTIHGIFWLPEVAEYRQLLDDLAGDVATLLGGTA
jgi:acetyl esterase